MSREGMKNQDTAYRATPDLFTAGVDLTNGSGPPPLSDADQRRLVREWSDANTRGDDEARCRIEEEILGRPSQEEPLKVRTRSPQHGGSAMTKSNKERKAV